MQNNEIFKTIAAISPLKPRVHRSLLDLPKLYAKEVAKLDKVKEIKKLAKSKK